MIMECQVKKKYHRKGRGKGKGVAQKVVAPTKKKHSTKDVDCYHYSEKEHWMMKCILHFSRKIIDISCWHMLLCVGRKKSKWNMMMNWKLPIGSLSLSLKLELNFQFPMFDILSVLSFLQTILISDIT